MTRRNIFHVLVCVAFQCADFEAKACGLYQKLQQFLSEEQMRTLLHDEDNIGLRPIEFAAQQGVFSLCGIIWDTNKVYRHVSYPCGEGEYMLYDITEYESHAHGTRHNKSPLMFLTYLDESKPSEIRLYAFGDWSQDEFIG